MESETMNKINITNGEAFNVFMKSKCEETFIPFNEAMIDGTPRYPLFEPEFIAERCSTHQVTMENYLEVAKEFLMFCQNIEQYDSITLWFGHDTFCQMNQLAVLAYLEQRAYKGQIDSVIIDDETRRIVQDKTTIQIGKFIEIYKALFEDGKVIKSGNLYLDNGMREYVELKDDSNTIISYIRNNGDSLDRKTMFENIWAMTRKYGLGDTQVKKMIETYSKLRFDQG